MGEDNPQPPPLADLEDFGSVEVTSRCCGAMTCRVLAPDIFLEAKQGSGPSDAPVPGSDTPIDKFTYVGREIKNEDELRQVRRAVKACPFNALRMRRGTTSREVLREDVNDAYPLPVGPHGEVYLLGHYSPKNAGASCYVIVRPTGGNVLIDAPSPDASLVERVKAMGDVAFMVFTHKDHTAFCQEWFEALGGGVQRVMHVADVVEEKKHYFFPFMGEVEIKVAGNKTQPLDKEGDIQLIPIPGHTPGSLAILYRNHYLFTGDSLHYSRPRGHLVSSRLHCWSSWEQQKESLRKLKGYDWMHVLPGHGDPKDFMSVATGRVALARGLDWMEEQPAGYTSLWRFLPWLQLKTNNSGILGKVPRWARKGVEWVIAPIGAPGTRERGRVGGWVRRAVLVWLVLKVLPRVLVWWRGANDRRRVLARAVALCRLPWGNPELRIRGLEGGVGR